ncbi:LysM peptidoglycan-binding domain-containing protein [Halobacillus yeomjeoni]|uniref:3D domain-containing protein n=1 Tax=Halobacillus yeomjeoni TaxID=311194 RepID=UPI001CD386B8|nr:3D domain-containing protein [Halobacillus yeomjeoni]MCA0985020.1 LysM peptidoglycan-binding domain-containing protein [Halobacillus yeomjeoni]
MKKTIFSLAAVTTIMGTTTVASAEELVVEKGDTLWGMAQENNVTVNHIKEINNLSSNLIYPRQTLTINERNDTEADTTSQSNQTEGTYTVKSGDTLWAISQEYGVSVSSLKSSNQLNSDLIHPGQQLTVDGSSEQTANTSHSHEEEAEHTSNEPSSEEQEATTMTMEATAYTAHCEGCSGTTYTGINLLENPDRKVIAVDPDVIPLGSEVYVEGYGKAIAGDIGGAIQGNRIDVFIPNRSDALDFGRQTVEVKVLDS